MDAATLDAADLTWVTLDQTRRLDRVAMRPGLTLPVMMENAGRSLAQVATRFWEGAPEADVLVGIGGNGGGAAVAR